MTPEVQSRFDKMHSDFKKHFEPTIPSIKKETILKIVEKAKRSASGKIAVFSTDSHGVSEYEHRQGFRYTLNDIHALMIEKGAPGRILLTGYYSGIYLSSLPKFDKQPLIEEGQIHYYGDYDDLPVLRTIWIPKNQVFYLNTSSFEGTADACLDKCASDLTPIGRLAVIDEIEWESSCYFSSLGWARKDGDKWHVISSKHDIDPKDYSSAKEAMHACEAEFFDYSYRDNKEIPIDNTVNRLEQVIEAAGLNLADLEKTKKANKENSERISTSSLEKFADFEREKKATAILQKLGARIEEKIVKDFCQILKTNPDTFVDVIGPFEREGYSEFAKDWDDMEKDEDLKKGWQPKGEEFEKFVDTYYKDFLDPYWVKHLKEAFDSSEMEICIRGDVDVGKTTAVMVGLCYNIYDVLKSPRPHVLKRGLRVFSQRYIVISTNQPKSWMRDFVTIFEAISQKDKDITFKIEPFFSSERHYQMEVSSPEIDLTLEFSGTSLLRNHGKDLTTPIVSLVREEGERAYRVEAEENQLLKQISHTRFDTSFKSWRILGPDDRLTSDGGSETHVIHVNNGSIHFSPGNGSKRCSECHGRGMLLGNTKHKYPYSLLNDGRMCPRCNGSGRVMEITEPTQ